MLRHDTINHLQQVMGHGGHQAFQTVPKILIKVIRDELWKERLDREGKPFASFEAFATAKLQQGLETTIDDLRAFCRRNEDALKAIDKVIKPELANGGDRRSDQFDAVKLKNAGGNSASYRRKRLKRDRADLYERFLAGELTLIAAEIEAGIKKPPSALDALRRAWAKASAEERRTFLAESG